MNLLELLTQSGALDAKAVPEIEAQLGQAGATPEGVLQKNGITLANILKVKGDYYNIPTREIGGSSVPFDVLRYVPEESARHYRFAPIGISDGRSRWALPTPTTLRRATRLRLFRPRWECRTKFIS